MKKVNVVLVMILFLMAGCAGDKKSTDDLITVDVTKSYSPKKKLILQDFMDVEYIPLETNDEFVNQGLVMDMGEKILLVRNRNRDGNIFVYDRTGKALRKINRKGQGGEEYTYISHIILDEDNNEMYVHDHHAKKIQVYDLYGNFKRSLQYSENAKGWFYTDICFFDKNNLICFDEFNNFEEDNKKRAFVLMSKQDGSITKKIKIPVKETKMLMKYLVDEPNNVVHSQGPGSYHTIITFGDRKILLEISSDTIYTFLPDHSLRPFMVRTPSVQSMDPEVVLVLRLLSDRYYFMETIKNEFDFDTGKGFSRTYLMYDTQEKIVSGYTVYNGDFSTKKEIYMVALRSVTHENAFCQSLESHQLVEAYKKGELKGKLKKIAATLEEDSNPVIMLVKHKK